MAATRFFDAGAVGSKGEGIRINENPHHKMSN